MQQIDIDFEVFKALTIRRKNEAHSYNEVLRELLGLSSSNQSNETGDEASNWMDGRTFGGRFLPNGTRLRATYKQQLYEANIFDGKLVDISGRHYSSVSAAARAVTKNNVNGLTFWHVKRPSDATWRKLALLPKVSE